MQLCINRYNRGDSGICKVGINKSRTYLPDNLESYNDSHHCRKVRIVKVVESHKSEIAIEGKSPMDKVEDDWGGKF